MTIALSSYINSLQPHIRRNPPMNREEEFALMGRWIELGGQKLANARNAKIKSLSQQATQAREAGDYEGHEAFKDEKDEAQQRPRDAHFEPDIENELTAIENRFVNAHLRAVIRAVSIVKKKPAYANVELEDLMAIAISGIYKRLHKFDPDKGRFKSWAIQSALLEIYGDKRSKTMESGMVGPSGRLKRYADLTLVRAEKLSQLTRTLTEDQIFHQAAKSALDDTRANQKNQPAESHTPEYIVSLAHTYRAHSSTASLNSPIGDGSEGATLLNFILDEDANPTDVALIEDQEATTMHSLTKTAIAHILAQPTTKNKKEAVKRQMIIFIGRQLFDPEDQLSLKETLVEYGIREEDASLADQMDFSGECIPTLRHYSELYGFSKERARQLEVEGFKKFEATIKDFKREQEQNRSLDYDDYDSFEFNLAA